MFHELLFVCLDPDSVSLVSGGTRALEPEAGCSGGVDDLRSSPSIAGGGPHAAAPQDPLPEGRLGPGAHSVLTRPGHPGAGAAQR
jgi:hypothetical protein